MNYGGIEGDRAIKSLLDEAKNSVMECKEGKRQGKEKIDKGCD